MILIGLTGGIASGKSEVAKRLVQNGAVHVDADLLAREVVEPGTAALSTIADEFGAAVVDAAGRLDRAALGAIVFADPDALRRLNDITHPAVRRLARDRIAAAGAHEVVVYDVPLLAESGSIGGFDRVVVVEAPVAERVRRMIEFRGMTEEQARARIAAQATDEERRAIADVVIVNDGTLEQLHERTDLVWADAAARARGEQPG